MFAVESESMLGTTITWAEYCEEGVWVVQRGTGALFLIKPGQNKIFKYGPISGAWCDDITVLKFVYVYLFCFYVTNGSIYIKCFVYYYKKYVYVYITAYITHGKR